MDDNLFPEISLQKVFSKWCKLSLNTLKNISASNQKDISNWYQSTIYLIKLLVTTTESFSYRLPKALQVTYLLTKYNRSVVLLSYCLINGFISISIMGAIAMWSNNPFVFPSLGPTAFLFFFSPKLPVSCPRNTLMGHFIGIVAGWCSLAVFGLLGDGSILESGVTLQRVFAAGLSLGLTCGFMAILECPHPPAGATTMIVSLGLITGFFGFFCMLLAVLLLTIQAFCINRMAGIDYPIWKLKAGL